MGKTYEKIHAIQVIGFILMIFITIAFAFPIVMSFMSAFKTNGEILKNPVAFPEGLYLGNFEFLFTRTQIPLAILHTLLLTVVSEILIILVVPMSSYAIARRPSKWTNAVYAFFLSGMMIPFQAYMVSLFKEMKMLGLFSTFTGTILIYISGSVAFGTLLFTSFIKTAIPAEMDEAAHIDGAAPLQLFWKIVFPLLAPCTASMVVLNSLGIWNDFLMPSLMLNAKRPSTLNVEIYYFIGQFNTRWGIVFAGAVISIVPAVTVFIALQKYFIKGIAAGAVKG